MGKKHLRETVWTKDKYYRIARKGSLDVNHPGMKILEKLRSLQWPGILKIKMLNS